MWSACGSPTGRGASRPTTTAARARVPLADTAGGGVEDVTWQGVAGYARVNLTARFFVTLRAEWFDDPQGARTGYRQTLTEVTVTPSFRVRPNLVVRGDLRRDHSIGRSSRRRMAGLAGTR